MTKSPKNILDKETKVRRTFSPKLVQ